MLDHAMTGTGFLLTAAGVSCCLLRFQDKKWFGAYFLFRELTVGLVITVAILLYLRKSNEPIAGTSLVTGLLWLVYGFFCLFVR